MFTTSSGRVIDTIRNWDYAELELKVLANLPMRNDEKIVFITEDDLFTDCHSQECKRLKGDIK